MTRLLSENCLWQLSPQPWWETIPGMMALYPLSRHSQPAAQAVQHAAEVIADAEPDGIIRADLLTTLAILGKLLYPRLEVMQLIGREQIRESKLYQEIKEEGREEGRVEGREEGRVEVLRTLVMESLEFRFGAAGVKEFGAHVDSMSDSQKLKQLHSLALRGGNLEEFRRRFIKH